MLFSKANHKVAKFHVNVLCFHVINRSTLLPLVGAVPYRMLLMSCNNGYVQITVYNIF